MKKNGVRHNRATKSKAVRLRSQGWSIKGIAKLLGVSPSTVLRWVQDVLLTNEQQAVLAQNSHEGRSGPDCIVSRLANERHLRWRLEAMTLWPKWKREPLFLLGVGIYWGEGNKTGQCLCVSNSDPGLIRAWVGWCRHYLPNIPLRLSIFTHADVDRTKAMAFWSSVTGCLVERCYSSIPKSSQGKRPRRLLPYGTLRVVVGRGSAEWHTKMLVWLGILQENAGFVQ